MADAINLATVADVVKDTMEVKHANSSNARTIKKNKSKKLTMRDKIAKLREKAEIKRSKKMAEVETRQSKLRAKARERKANKLDAVRVAKNSKYNLAELKAIPYLDFLNEHDRKKIKPDLMEFLKNQKTEYFLNDQDKFR